VVGVVAVVAVVAGAMGRSWHLALSYPLGKSRHDKHSFGCTQSVRHLRWPAIRALLARVGEDERLDGQTPTAPPDFCLPEPRPQETDCRLSNLCR